MLTVTYPEVGATAGELPAEGSREWRMQDRPVPWSVAGGSIERVTEDPGALWDAEAEAFDEAADHGLHDPEVRQAWAELLLPLINGRGRRVADLGCGTGTLSILLASEGGHLVSPTLGTGSASAHSP